MSSDLSVSTKCSALTKKGTRCRLNAELGGMCGLHFSIHLEKKSRSDNMCKLYDCCKWADVDLDGYCVDHFIQFGLPQNQAAGAAASRASAASAVPQDIHDAFRTLELEPTTDQTVVKAQYRDLIRRPDIRVAFTSTEVNDETRCARAMFEKIQTAFELLKTKGYA